MIDANKVAHESGIGTANQHDHANVFLRVSRMCCRQNEAIAQIKESIQKTYAKKGQEVVEKNIRAVDETLAASLRG